MRLFTIPLSFPAWVMEAYLDMYFARREVLSVKVTKHCLEIYYLDGSL